MNNTFVDTFELSYRDSCEKIEKLMKNIDSNDKNKKNDNEFKMPFNRFKYNKQGLIITTRSSGKEARDGKGDFMISIRVNPSRLICEGTYVNMINNEYDFILAVRRLFQLLNDIFPDLSYDDYTLRRFDITRDMRNVPERVINEYINIMYRTPFAKGYLKNEELIENTDDFREKDSFNVVNKSQGAEFVVYNKHRSTIDQNYPEEAQKYYENTMRVEMRCKQHFINKKTKNMSLAESLLHMYLKRDKYLVKMFESIFKYQTYLCYISPEWQEKFIIKLCKKKKLGNDLKKTVKYLKKNNIPLDKALSVYFNSRNAINNKLSGFCDLGFSPLPISDHKISYLLPLDKALGFSTVYENDKCYMKISQSKGRKKEMFTYESGEE